MKEIYNGFYGEVKPLVFENGNAVTTIYRDTAVTMTDTECFTERKMVVDGKTFYVKSIFPTKPSSTPSKELISLIDDEKDIKRNNGFQ